jgi:hypothetical protein
MGPWISIRFATWIYDVTHDFISQWDPLVSAKQRTAALPLRDYISPAAFALAAAI